jgi:DNA-binding MarR family transcriptional regulator
MKWVMNLGQLSTVLNLEKSTTSRLVTELLNKGICHTQPDENDRRNKLIALTKKGLQLVNKIHFEAKLQVQLALDMMNEKEKNTVVHLSPEQMAIFIDLLPTEFDGRVTVVCGNFLQETDFPDEHFDQVFMQNVMHFFKLDHVNNCLSRIFGWLKSGGSLTVTTSTPYWSLFSGDNNHIAIFEQKKQQGDEQAGFIENLKEYFVQRTHPIAKIVPEGTLHNFNDVTLQRTLEHQGFQIIKVGFFAMPKTFPLEFQLDGREYVGAIACKPTGVSRLQVYLNSLNIF